MCDHGFIGACAECDGCGQTPEVYDEPDRFPCGCSPCSDCGEAGCCLSGCGNECHGVIVNL